MSVSEGAYLLRMVIRSGFLDLFDFFDFLEFIEEVEVLVWWRRLDVGGRVWEVVVVVWTLVRVLI